MNRLPRLEKATAVGLSVFALGGCGPPPPRDPNSIKACPKGYVESGASKIDSASRSHFRAALGQAVVKLGGLLPIRPKYGGLPIEPPVGATTQERQAITAASIIFPIDQASGSGKSNDKFQTYADGTKVDDPDEQFCTDGTDFYIAPPAAAAVSAMKGAGVDVSEIEELSK